MSANRISFFERETPWILPFLDKISFLHGTQNFLEEFLFVSKTVPQQQVFRIISFCRTFLHESHLTAGENFECVDSFPHVMHLVFFVPLLSLDMLVWEIEQLREQKSFLPFSISEAVFMKDAPHLKQMVFTLVAVSFPLHELLQ